MIELLTKTIQSFNNPFKKTMWYLFINKPKTTKMKRQIILTLLAICTFSFVQAQKQSLSVLNIDAQGVEFSSVQIGNLVRLEMDKLDKFEVMDKYDVAYLVEKNELKIENCYGKICLLEVGKLIGSDKMFTGSVERYSKTIIVTLRLIDVKKGIIEKTQVNEFLNLQNEMQRMIGITVHDMFGLENEPSVVSLLTQNENLDNAITMPNEPRLNLSGPRMGVSYLAGEAGEIYQAPKGNGGFDAYPALFQFGYQFEVQYLNEGNIQGLFEFIPLVSGLEQGFFIPSLTILHGLRNNKNGIEFAFGPTLSLARYANGYYDADNNWNLEYDWTSPTGEPNPNSIVSRLDSRGALDISTGFVIAAGFTVKSGKLNIPMNVYIVPRKNNFRIGASFGFNARR